MIQIESVHEGNIHRVTPTIFPDGTSQVWKLPLNELSTWDEYLVIWYFEDERELFHLIQLMDLMKKCELNVYELYIPFLPYGRQDKEISNDSTFALKTFIGILTSYFHESQMISTLDPHSEIDRIYSYDARDYIDRALEDSGADVVVFPDKGAALRYWRSVGNDYVIMEKDRDQQTGQIRGMKFSEETMHVEIEGKKILIVDDICDGGATFIGAAKLLHEHEVDTVDLYVTHGIFSQGTKVLHNNGINRIFTTKSIIHNDFGYDLLET